jgi:predicted transcriptional regulator
MINLESEFKLTKMAKKIFEGLLKESNPVSAQELAEKLNLPILSVRYGIKLLIDQNLVFKYTEIVDMRKTLYSVSNNSYSDSNTDIDLELFL